MNKILKTILVVLVVILVALTSFAGGIVTGHFLPMTGLPALQAPVGNAPGLAGQQPATPADLQTTFAPFWEAWTLVHENYVEQPVNDVTLMQGAISGMMSTLTIGRNYYYDPKTLAEQTTALNGKEYGGIGAGVDVDKEYLTIITPFGGSPAEKAGLISGDQVIAVDGVDMTGVLPEEVRQKVIGPEGTDVVLTILREGMNAPFDVKITRAFIKVPLVESKMRPDGIAYVRLNTFGKTADAELKKALTELLAQNPKGLILDLRYNPGGLLDQGISVASEFLPKGKIVAYEKYGDGTLKSYTSLGGGAATDIPMVVLVNEGSASASEIVAGALQDYGRAKLIGTVSYGKGSVQNFIPLQNDQGAIGVTIALWLTPNKRSINHLGLAPDIRVEITQADIDAKLDFQLETAAQALLAMINGSPLPTSMPSPTPIPTHVPVP